jgi:hypothetical protein
MADPTVRIMQDWAIKIWAWAKGRVRTLDLLPTYLGLAKNQGWEIIQTAGLFGVVFLLWSAIGMSAIALLFYLAVIAFVAGYYIWRADHAFLVPTIGLAEPAFRFHDSSTLDQSIQRRYLQILPVCASDASVEECQGYLQGIKRWNGKGWVPTEYDHAMNLAWSFQDRETKSVRLDPGVDKRLNVLWVDSQFKVSIETLPQYAGIASLVQESGPLRFDIRLVAKDQKPLDLQLKIRIGITGGQPLDWRKSLIVEQLPVPISIQGL